MTFTPLGRSPLGRYYWYDVLSSTDDDTWYIFLGEKEALYGCSLGGPSAFLVPIVDTR